MMTLDHESRTTLRGATNGRPTERRFALDAQTGPRRWDAASLWRTCLLCLATTVLVSCSASDPRAQVASAKAHLEAGDRKSAIILVKSALQSEPDFAEARFLLGELLLKEGNAASAEIELQRALDLGHLEDQVVPPLARAVLATGNSAGVVNKWADKRLADPARDADLRSTIADAYERMGERELALGAIRQLLALFPDHSAALLVRARIYAKTGQLKLALADAVRVTETSPKNAQAWQLKGDFSQMAGAIAQDVEGSYLTAISVDSSFEPAYASLVLSLLRRGDLKGAAAQLGPLKAISPQGAMTAYLQALLAYGEGDDIRTKDLTSQILRALPTSSRALLLAGAADLRMGNLYGAESNLSRALRAQPGLLPAHQLLVSTYLRSGDAVRAIQTLEPLMSDPLLAPGLYKLAGEANLLYGNAARAEMYFNKAIETKPEDASNRVGLAAARLANGKDLAALEELSALAKDDSGTAADLVLISAHSARKDYRAAWTAITQLESKPHDKAMVALLKGNVQLAMGDRPEARRHFVSALAINPSHLAATSSLAGMEMADGHPDRARAWFEKAIEADPKSSQIRLAYAGLLSASGADRSEVLATMRKAVQTRPEDATAQLQLVTSLIAAKDPKEAVSAAQKALDLLPDHYELTDALGRAQQLAGASHQALATFGKLIPLRPGSAHPHLRLAEAHLANGEPAASRADLLRALDIDPSSVDAHRGLVMLAINERKFEEASAHAQALKSRWPQLPLGYLLEGEIGQAKQGWQGAMVAYRSGLAKLPESQEIAIRLHVALLASKRAEEAARFAAERRAAYPAHFDFLMHLGSIALVRKDLEAAESILRRAMALRPEDTTAINNLAWVLGQLNKPGAIDLARKAVRMSPAQAAFHDTLAELLSKDGDFANAIAAHKTALRLEPENPAFQFKLARTYVKSGDKASAKPILDALAKLGPKFPAQAEISDLSRAN